MPRLQKQNFDGRTRHLTGARLTVLTESATKTIVAVVRAKKRIYKKGDQPIFCTFVPTSN